MESREASCRDIHINMCWYSKMDVGSHLQTKTLIIPNRNMKKVSFSEDQCSKWFGWIRYVNLKPVWNQIYLLQSM